LALNPAVINRMLETSERIKSSDPEAAFLVSWAALEGFLHRVLVVAIQYQGLSAKDAVELVSSLGIHRRASLERALGSVLGQPPSNLPRYGRDWRSLYAREQGSHRSYHERRHGLIHGSKHANPVILGKGVDAIVEMVRMPLFGLCEVSIHAGTQRGTSLLLGDVLTPYSGRLGSATGSATVQDVTEAYGWHLWRPT